MSSIRERKEPSPKIEKNRPQKKCFTKNGGKNRHFLLQIGDKSV